MLDVILIIVSALCMIAGLAGCVLPFLPGPPIAYLGLVFLHFTDKVHYTSTQLIIWLLIVVSSFLSELPQATIPAAIDTARRRAANFFIFFIMFLPLTYL